VFEREGEEEEDDPWDDDLLLRHVGYLWLSERDIGWVVKEVNEWKTD
jgi:hypothetical protein